MNRNIARLPKIAAARLMHHDAAMRQAVAPARAATAQQQAPHGRGLPDADGGHRRTDVGHGVVDGEAGGDAAAGAVDVQVDGFGGVVGFEEEELRDDGGGHGLVDVAVEADDAFFQQAGEDVVLNCLSVARVFGSWGCELAYMCAIHLPNRLVGVAGNHFRRSLLRSQSHRV